MTQRKSSAMYLGKPLMDARDRMAEKGARSVPCYTVRCDKEKIIRQKKEEQRRDAIKGLYSAFFG